MRDQAGKLGKVGSAGAAVGLVDQAERDAASDGRAQHRREQHGVGVGAAGVLVGRIEGEVGEECIEVGDGGGQLLGGGVLGKCRQVAVGGRRVVDPGLLVVPRAGGD